MGELFSESQITRTIGTLFSYTLHVYIRSDRTNNNGGLSDFKVLDAINSAVQLSFPDDSSTIRRNNGDSWFEDLPRSSSPF